jgi:plasmid maintenance system antidote protein VapI
MALRIERACAVKMDTLMRMQNSYDIAAPASTRRKFVCGAFTAPPT